MKAKEIFGKGISKIKNFRLTRRVFAYPYVLFMLAFVVAPLIILLVNAFLDTEGGFTFDNFKSFFTDDVNLRVLGMSLAVGVITTVLCLVIGYPVAYILSKWSSGSIIVLLIILPMWVNFLIRTYALKSIFDSLDVTLGIGTVIVGMVYNFIPYMIMPLHTTISNIDPSYAEAAKDLGCNGVQTFLRSTLPLSVPFHPDHFRVCDIGDAFQQHRVDVRRFDKPQVYAPAVRHGIRHESYHARVRSDIELLHEPGE